MGFTYNGITSQSMGIMARLTGWQAAPKLRNYLITIPNADGVADFGCNLTEREITINCSILPRFSLTNLMSVIDNMMSWLNPKNGTKALVFDGLEDRFFNARLADSFDLERLAFNSANFDLKFIAPDPFAYAASDELFTIAATGSSSVSRIKGNADSLPVYTVQGIIPAGSSTNIMIIANGDALTIIGGLSSSESLVIDSGKLTAYVKNSSGSILRNGLQLLQGLNFPILHTGSNTVNISTAGATFTQLLIEAKSRWL
jgi:predicted phage tail component-like protein